MSLSTLPHHPDMIALGGRGRAPRANNEEGSSRLRDPTRASGPAGADEGGQIPRNRSLMRLADKSNTQRALYCARPFDATFSWSRPRGRRLKRTREGVRQ
jgi:hypothetical protein